MAFTKGATFVRSQGQEEEEEAPAGDQNVPPLDKIPTNEFIEKFLEDDDDVGVKRSNTDLTTSIQSITNGYKKSGHRENSVAKKKTSAALPDIEPFPEDQEDLETVIDIKENYPTYDDTGQKAYENACKRYGALPCSSFHKQLAKSASINLRHYNTGPRGAIALSIPMVINTRITTLNLSSNDLSGAGIEWVGKMMVENTCITELDLSDNKLRTQGAKVIGDILQANNRLRWLNISGNDFSDYDSKLLSKPVEENSGLRYLNLSNNSFGATGNTGLRSMIGENGFLQELDLSWNQIRSQGAVDVARGVKENIGLKTLWLGWNGMGDDGAKELSLALKTTTLTELDLTSNRIGAQGFVAFCKGLKDNDDLKTIKMSKNPIPEDAANAIMEFFAKTEALSVELLEMGEIMYSSSFQEKITSVQIVHENFQCPYGYMDSYGKRRLKQYNVVAEAMGAMRQYCEQRNINIVELFSRFDADGSMSVTHDEFKQGLKEAGIPLTDYQIEELIRTLDQDGDGEIDFSEMVLGAEMYKGDDQ